MFVHFLIKMSDLISQLTHNSFFITLGGDNKTFDKLATLMLTGSTTHQITEIIMQCQPLRNAVKFLFLKNVNVQCQSNLCNRSPEKSSVLLTPPTKHKVLRQQ